MWPFQEPLRIYLKSIVGQNAVWGKNIDFHPWAFSPSDPPLRVLWGTWYTKKNMPMFDVLDEKLFRFFETLITIQLFLKSNPGLNLQHTHACFLLQCDTNAFVMWKKGQWRMHNYVHDKIPQKTIFLKICKILKTVESQLCKTRHCFATSTTATRLSQFENEPMTNVNTSMIPN